MTSSHAGVDDPILWHEGMLLTPQHFQQHDRRFQRLLRHQMEQQNPYYYGLSALSFNAARLDDGLLQIDQLHAVLPDGLVVMRGMGGTRVPDGEARLSLDLKDDPTLQAKGRVRVYLTVPEYGAGAASDQASIRRYDGFEGPAMVDDNTGQDPLVVLRLRPRVTLFAGLAEPEGCVAMPILEVRREPAGRLIVAAYHPPLLELGASDFLGRRGLQAVLEKLLEKVRRKASRLATMKGNRSQNLFALTAALPELEVLVRSKRARPFEVYRALAKLVGSASALDPEGVPPLLEAYPHEDMLRAFGIAVRYVDELVSNLELEYEMLAFELTAPDTFELFIEAGWETAELVIEVKAAAAQDAAAVNAWVAEARIGSADRSEWLAQQRSPGAWSERLSAPAAARYTQRAGVHFFQLRNRQLPAQGASYPVIAAGQPLRIAGGGRVAPPEAIVLYRRPGAEKGAKP